MTRLWLVLLGAWVGVVGLLVHRQTWTVGGGEIPWGLAAVLLTTAAVVHGASSWRHIGGAWFAIGWIVVLMAERALGRGSYLIASDWLGWAFMVGGLAVIAADVVLASRLKP